MTTYSIFTWNTQGDFTKTEKLNEINSMFPSGIIIGCIQEGGVEKEGRHGKWNAYGGLGIGSFNERCTNYVLLDATYSLFVTVTPHILVNGDRSLVVGGGVAGRTPAAVGMGNILFVSWHSLSGQSNEDTSMLIRSIESNTEYTQNYDTVVIGGDFNSSPGAIGTLINLGTDRTRSMWTYTNRYVINSGQPTHTSNNELDFFIVLSKTPWTSTGMFANLKGVEMKAVVPSDHNPVLMKFFV